MKSHTIAWLKSAGLQVPWKRIPSALIDCYPWYQSGAKQSTSVQLALSRRSLHVRFECEDSHISAQVTEPNGPVCRDSCVEFFFAPNPEKTLAYFNLEMNCCGTVHLGYGEGRHHRICAPREVLDAIRVTHSVPGPSKAESPDDDGWELEAVIPLHALIQMARFPAPAPGASWRGNLYRCGGLTDPQYACWAPIDRPQPDFHRPEFFGLLRIESLKRNGSEG